MPVYGRNEKSSVNWNKTAFAYFTQHSLVSGNILPRRNTPWCFILFYYPKQYIIWFMSIRIYLSTAGLQNTKPIKAITITGIVYNFVLYKIYLDWNTVGYTYSRTILHLIMPVGFILDWLLFDEHRRMLWRDLFIWLSYPIIYAFCSIFMSFRYNDSLYFFFDIQNGFQTMLKWLAILFFSLLLTGCLYICVDRHLGRKTRDKSVKGS